MYKEICNVNIMNSKRQVKKKYLVTWPNLTIAFDVKLILNLSKDYASADS